MDRITVMSWLEGLTDPDWSHFHSDSEVQNIASEALSLLKEDCHNCKLECLLQKYDELKEKYDALLKEQEAVKPEKEHSGSGITWWNVCGNCKTAINPNDKYCHECGKPVLWEGQRFS